MPDLHIEYRPPEDLTGHPGNARTHSNRQIRQIARSIEAFGFANPILVDECDRLIAGHGRLAAARNLGLRRVTISVWTGGMPPIWHSQAGKQSVRNSISASGPRPTAAWARSIARSTSLSLFLQRREHLIATTFSWVGLVATGPMSGGTPASILSGKAGCRNFGRIRRPSRWRW
ncbi:hypothetical protein SuNHUV7_20210 (plasmid) [Pseudoseohaeicola sp. NH-UV-7]